IADRERAHHVIEDVQRTMGRLRGIIHTAMVLDDAPIERLDEERMWTAMRPKMIGAWNLHALTIGIPLDFFVMFSSITSIIGNPGQANYVAGNAFLDMLAYYRRARGLPALTVNWGRVGDVGHVVNNPEATQRLDRLGITIMPLSETLDALDELMSSDAVQVAAAQVEWKGIFRVTGSRIPARYSGLVGDAVAEEGRSTASSGARDILEAEEAALPSLLERYMRDLLARAMGTSPARIDLQQSLFNLGVDSLIAVEVRNRVHADLGVNVPLAKLMKSASISSFAVYVGEQLIERGRGERSRTAHGDNAAQAKASATISDKHLDEDEAARPALRADARPAEVPLSFAQRRLWFINRLEGPSAT